MNMKIIVATLVLLVAVGGIMWVLNRSQTPGELDNFALCLKDKKVTFYGAFWCPHCQNQKKLFGYSQRLLPYVECSTPDGQGTTPICSSKNIKSYPTWEFPDGSQQVGEVSLKELAQKSGCELPQK